MAMTPPTAGELRATLRFERRTTGVNVGGVPQADWSSLIEEMRAKIAPRLGGEEVIAGRMSGAVSTDIWVRNCQATRDLVHNDRAIDVNTDKIYNLGQPIDPFAGDPVQARKWLLIQATASGMVDPSMSNYNFLLLEI